MSGVKRAGNVALNDRASANWKQERMIQGPRPAYFTHLCFINLLFYPGEIND